MIRRLYIMFKIWRIKSEIESISSDSNYYKIALMSLSIRYQIKDEVSQKIYNDYLKHQLERKKELIEKLKTLKNSLEKL